MADIVRDDELRRLTLEVLATGSTDSWQEVRRLVTKRVEEDGLGSLGSPGAQRISQAIIGLIVEQLVTIGAKSGTYEPSWPSIVLTAIGKTWAHETSVQLRDPDRYGALLKGHAPDIEQATVEYAVEALKCLQQNLLLACAVMIGAAAEREIFRLGRAVLPSLTDQREVKKLDEALERGQLPSLFHGIRVAIARAVESGSLPYKIHQGSVEHLLSFQEMVRVHRNEAVHSGPEPITKEKVFLSLQTLPTALGVIDRLRRWFESGASSAPLKGQASEEMS